MSALSGELSWGASACLPATRAADEAREAGRGLRARDAARDLARDERARRRIEQPARQRGEVEARRAAAAGDEQVDAGGTRVRLMQLYLAHRDPVGRHPPPVDVVLGARREVHSEAAGAEQRAGGLARAGRDNADARPAAAVAEEEGGGEESGG